MQGFISAPKPNNTFFAVVLLSLYLLLRWISLRLTLNFLLQCADKFLMKMPNYFTFMLGKRRLWKYWIVLVWKCISFYYKTWGNKQSLNSQLVSVHLWIFPVLDCERNPTILCLLHIPLHSYLYCSSLNQMCCPLTPQKEIEKGRGKKVAEKMKEILGI